MLHPEIAKLADLVAKWADLLKRYHGKNDWIEWLENDVRYLRNSDFYGVEHLLSAFGGMGSIADFSLVSESGSLFSRSRARFINRRYSRLVTQIYELADRLRREELASSNCR
jgi:hypothetical protein